MYFREVYTDESPLNFDSNGKYLALNIRKIDKITLVMGKISFEQSQVYRFSVFYLQSKRQNASIFLEARMGQNGHNSGPAWVASQEQIWSQFAIDFEMVP